MLQRMARSLFWKQNYRKFWSLHGFAFGGVDDLIYGPLTINAELLKWDRKLDEKKAYWGTSGKFLGYTAEQAAFRAMQETADDFYKAYADHDDMEETWLRIADRLEYIAKCYVRDPQTYQSYEDRLSPHWKAYCHKLHERREVSKKRGQEVRSYRFSESYAKLAWKDLVRGEVLDEAKRIWMAMPRSAEAMMTAHEIADAASVSVERFVFWMIVLRDGNLVREYPQEEPKYIRERLDTVNSQQTAALNALEGGLPDVH